MKIPIKSKNTYKRTIIFNSHVILNLSYTNTLPTCSLVYYENKQHITKQISLQTNMKPSPKYRTHTT